MTQEQLHAWAAGFFDGEGYIGVGDVDKLYATVHIKVGQRVRKPLVVLEQLGGRILGPYSNNQYVWIAIGHAAVEILQHMRPYLQLKDEQADLAIRWMSIGRGMGRPLSPQEREERIRIAQRIKAANRPWLQ